MKFQSLLGDIDRTVYIEITYAFLFLFYALILIFAIYKFKVLESANHNIKCNYSTFLILIVTISICISYIGRIASFTNIIIPLPPLLYALLNLIPCNNLLTIGILIFSLSFEDYHSLSGTLSTSQSTFKLKMRIFKFTACFFNLSIRIFILFTPSFLPNINYKEIWAEAILSFIVSVGLIVMSYLLIDRIQYLFELEYKNIVKNNICVVILIYCLVLASRIFILSFTIWELNGNIPEEDGVK